MHLIRRQTCRVCGSAALKKVIDLGDQNLQGSFVKPGKELPPLRRLPTSLVRCNPMQDEKACGLLQMEHSVPPEILYAAYWYRSGTNATMKSHLKEIVDTTLSLLKKEKGNVLDIGCNDGTLLNFYSDKWSKYGCDPSDIAQEVKFAKVVQDIFPSPELSNVIGNEKIDVITSIAMFYDLENPVEFVKSVKKILSKEGIWVFEMSYMPKMLAIDSYDTICHEHLEFYSLAVLEKIVGMADMKIFKISFNDINGGSIRCYATHKESSLYYSAADHKLMNDIRLQEFDLELDTDKPYVAFQYRIEKVKNELYELLLKLKNDGKKVHIYGASTKGNTILQWCNINNMLVEYAAERNPDKYGAHTLGTNIPIISEADSRAMNPDYYLVLPWHFKEEFIEREKDALDKGTGFIFPIPTIDIYKK